MKLWPGRIQHLPDLSMSRSVGHMLRPIPGPKAGQQSTSWRGYRPGWNQHLHDLSMSRSAGHTHIQIPSSKAPALRHNSVRSRAPGPVQQGSHSTRGPPGTDSGTRQGETALHAPHESQHTHLQETSHEPNSNFVHITPNEGSAMKGRRLLPTRTINKDTVIMRWLVLSVFMYWIICPTPSS